MPLSIASQMGWAIHCPFEFRVCWLGGNETRDLIVEIEDDGKAFVSSHFGSGILTFALPVKFQTNNPYGLIVTAPLNVVKPGIHPLAGYVETHWSPYPFTMNWKMGVVGKWISFTKNEPVCMILPYEARLLERTQVRLKHESFAPSNLKNQFMAWLGVRKNSRFRERDRLYFKGQCPITKLKVTKDHILRLALRRFTD